MAKNAQAQLCIHHSETGGIYVNLIFDSNSNNYMYCVFFRKYAICTYEQYCYLLNFSFFKLVLYKN